MKLKFAILLVVVVLSILFSGVVAFAADVAPADGYDDNDFDKIQAFLDQLSTDGVTTNGAVLNAGYNNTDPTTWAGVTWASTRATSIDWHENYTLNGNLDLSGFDALTDVLINVNSIDSLNVAGDTALTTLNAASNSIGTIDVTSLSALENLSIQSNNLSALNVSNNSNLLNLNCELNNITTLDASNNTGLLTLLCRGNDITSLNTTGLTVLTELGCSSNNLTSVDVSTNVSLQSLSVNSNTLSGLDVSALGALTFLNCNSTSLTTIDLSNNTLLETLYCAGNSLSSLNLTSNTSLIDLTCSYNPLPALNLSTNTALQTLYANSCQLSTLNTSANAALTTLEAQNNSLSSIDISGNANLQLLNVSTNSLSAITIPSGSALATMIVNGNNLTTLDLSPATGLTSFYGYNNQLTSVNLTGCSSLAVLYVYNNQLTSIDLSTNSSMRNLRLNDNSLTAIDVSVNLALDYLDIQNNDITALDLSTNTAMVYLGALGNELHSLDIIVSTIPVTVTSRGLGTFDALYSKAANQFYSTATPTGTNEFFNWTNPGSTVLSTNNTYNISAVLEPDVIANFTAGVIFDANGGTVPSNPTYSMAGPGELITEPTPPEYFPLTFTGWYTEPEQITQWDFATDVVPPSGLLTLYAGWTGNFTVTFNGNGGTPVPADITVAYNSTFTEPVTQPTLANYDFGGWCTDPAGTVHWDYADVVTQNMTLYADWNPQAFNVWFNENGGTSLPSPTSRVVYYGGLVPYVTTEPELAGYVIEGWYTDNTTYTYKWDFATDTVAGNMTLYVRWIHGNYTITFNSPGATTPANPETMSFSYNDYITPLPTPPTRSGYTFDVWCLDAGLTQPINFSTYQVTGDVNLYARWIPNNYTVTYNRNGGATDAIPSSVIVPYNTVIPSQPTPPTRPGYVLDAWCRDSAGNNVWNFATDHVLGDTTLYARWIPTHTVTFNNNGGSTEANPQTMVVVDNQTISPEPLPPTRTGYTFNGWYTDAGATTAWSFASNLVTSDLTLYAGWTRNNYTVTFNNNGGDTAANPATMSVPYNTVIPSQPTPPTMTGFLFEAWYRDAATTTPWNFATDVVTNNITLYAGYSEYFTVTFSENGGTVPASPATVDVLENHAIGTAAPTPPIRPGYQFDGWFTEVAAVNEWDMNTDLITGDTTLYAGWTSFCTVTFDQNGGDTGAIPNTKQTLLGETVTAPAISPTRTGYVFSGWYTSVDATTQWNFTSAVTSSMTLYAGWTPIAYTVTFNENGGDSLAVPGSMTVDYGQLISPEPTPPLRTGYIFNGWFIDAAATIPWNFATDTVSGNTTLYAGWTAVYTVRFSRNGGDTPASPNVMSVLAGELIAPAPIAPTRVGYTFTGWYIDSSATIAFDISTNAINNDMVLYAGWSINTYTVTFDENGGDSPAFPTTMTVDYGDLIASAPTDPALAGFAFYGWFTDASATTEWDFATDMVTGDMTLYALYVPLVTVTFDTTGADTPAVPATLSVGEGLVIDTPPTPPTRDGYTFVGWYTDSALTTLWVMGVDTVTSGMTLYAGWTDLMWTVTFNVNGGTTAASIESYSAPDGSILYVVPDDPTRAGYVFEGWYRDAAGTTPWNFTTETITQNTVLYAIWSEALALSGAPSNGEIYEDGRIEITPNISGGTWTYDDTYLSATVTSTGVVFTGLRAGTTTVTYTADGQTVQYIITISVAALPSTGQSYTLLFALLGLAGLIVTLLVGLLLGQPRALKKRQV